MILIVLLMLALLPTSHSRCACCLAPRRLCTDPPLLLLPPLLALGDEYPCPPFAMSGVRALSLKVTLKLILGWLERRPL